MGITLEELRARLTAKWSDFFHPDNDRDDLVRRFHRIMFVSEHVQKLEEVTKRSYLDLNKNLIRQVCRDRTRQKEIKAAWQSGERTFEGKKIGGSGEYVWRWGREDAVEVLEMIEEVLRGKEGV